MKYISDKAVISAAEAAFSNGTPLSNTLISIIKEILDAAPAVDMQCTNDWVCTEDKLPEEAEKVLLYTTYHTVGYGFFTGAYYNNKPLFAMTRNRQSEHPWYEETRISHWCALPEPPIE